MRMKGIVSGRRLPVELRRDRSRSHHQLVQVPGYARWGASAPILQWCHGCGEAAAWETSEHRDVPFLLVWRRTDALGDYVINSFLTHGFVYELYSYDVPRLVPQRVVLRPAETIVQAPENMASGTDPSRFSNWFRYNLLDRLGGWWVDTDVVCNTASIPAAEIASAVEDRHGTVAAGTLESRWGTPLSVSSPATPTQTAIQLGHGGPKLVTQVLSAPSSTRTSGSGKTSTRSTGSVVEAAPARAPG